MLTAFALLAVAVLVTASVSAALLNPAEAQSRVTIKRSNTVSQSTSQTDNSGTTSTCTVNGVPCSSGGGGGSRGDG